MINREKLHDFLLNNGLTTEQYSCIRDNVVKSNTASNTVVCIISVVYLFAMMIVSLCGISIAPWYVFGAGGVVAVLCLVLNRCCIKKGSKILKYLVYLLVLDLMLVGFFIGTVYSRESVAVTYVVLLVLLPIMFTDRCYRELLFILISMIVFIIADVFLKTGKYLSTDILNVIVFGTASIVTTTFMSIAKVQSFWKGYVIEQMAIRDSLTGTYNRTKYDEVLKVIGDKIETNISCIYIDVNGLHVYNNTHGHAAGDEMLKCIAGIIKDVLSDEEVFRTGGDEFVALIMDSSESKISDIAKIINSRVKQSGYSVSMGVSTMYKEQLDMKALVGVSESLMYEDKRNYYLEHGLEIRNENRS